MQPIINALSVGYRTRTILSYIKRMFPQYRQQIETAEIAGYSADSIIKSLSKGASQEEQDKLAVLTENERTRENDEKNKRKALAGTVATGLAVAGGIYGLNRVASAGRAIYPNQILPPLPPGPPQLPGPPGLPQLPLSPRGVPQPPGPSAGTPQGPIPNAPITPQAAANIAETQTPSPPSPPAIKPNVQLVKNIQEDVRLANLISGGMDIATISDLLPKIVRKDKLKVLERAEGGLPQVIQDFSEYLQKNPQERSRPLPTAAENLQPETTQEQTTPLDVPEQRTFYKPKKNDLVLTPYGPAEIKGVDAKGVIADVEGKTERFDLEDIEEPKPEVKKAIEDLLKIPEEDRSSNIALFSYDPTDNEAFFQFHDGSFYRYKSVPPELVKEIAEKNAIPITTGENMYGAWSPNDKKSIGAALWKYMLKDPRWAKAKKGEEKNANYRKLDVHYDYWEKLRSSKKRKHKKGNL